MLSVYDNTIRHIINYYYVIIVDCCCGVNQKSKLAGLAYRVQGIRLPYTIYYVIIANG